MKISRHLAAALLAAVILLTGCAQELPSSSTGSQAEQTTASTGEIGATAAAQTSSGTVLPDDSGAVAPAESSASASESATAPVESTTSTTASSVKPAVTTGSTAATAAPVTTASTTVAKPQTKPREDGTGLTETGRGYEGTKGTGDFNYGEALQKSLMFYELQRSGDLDENNDRTNWRGDSGMTDGADVGLDLTGGLYDAGDNVKFNLPMAYTASVLAWSVYEDRDAYEESGQLEYILDTIRWVNDYLIKCHPEDDVYYYQVGDGNKDHAWWGAAEVMQMDRPSFKVTANSPGSAVVGEAAASLAACALVFEDTDPAYAKKCIAHAKQLYDFAERTKSDSGYTAANGFYNSWSGFYDELAWAGVWLYLATDSGTYLDKAEKYIVNASCDYKWTMCWDDVSIGACTMLAKLTGKQSYKDKVEKNLDWWTTGTGGERVTYTPKGLAWIDSWGSLRYATTSAFIAAVYSDWKGCPSSKKQTYTDFYESQINYALGSSGRSFVVGYGENPPEHPHHRTAQGSWADNMNEPNYHRHTLYGALVGGPNANDGYSDIVSDFNCNEVACDYNAGFTGVLARMYSKYGGQTLIDFGAVEETGEELYVEYRANAQGNGFTEIKALVYNKTSWPARVCEGLELRYFMDLSEIYAAGGNAGQLSVTTNYTEGGKAGGIYCWNEDKHIYYVSIDFSGAKLYPGGQSAYKKEVQFRITSGNGVWDASNDPSYKELIGTNGSSEVRARSMALYEGGELVFGTEPGGRTAGNLEPVKPSPSTGGNTGNNTPVPALPQNPSAEDNGISVSLNQQSLGGAGNTIQFMLDIVNNTGSAIDLENLTIDYFFTCDGNSSLNFWCDHAATNGTGYVALTSAVTGVFSTATGEGCDTRCRIGFTGGVWNAGDSMTVQVRLTRSDWTDFVLDNDYSAGNAQRIVISRDRKVIFGEKP